jgi:SAM-dependent methyltransferase
MAPEPDKACVTMRSAGAERTTYREFTPVPEREAACRAKLTEYLTRVGQDPVDRNVDELFSLESGVSDRFDYFAPRVPKNTRRRLLVSGCAAASEMIIARRYGFQEILGTEVVQEYVEISRQRLLGQDGFDVFLYDGKNLPFASDTFTAVVSGHIIEHTPSAYDYLKEHVRVLAPGGFLFLEFPNRYHLIELHTGLPSLEYLPKLLRSLGLQFLGSQFSPLSPKQRKRYDEIRRTLQPVSVWQIKRYLSRMTSCNARVIHHYAPAPGYTRMLIAKSSSHDHKDNSQQSE